MKLRDSNKDIYHCTHLDGGHCERNLPAPINVRIQNTQNVLKLLRQYHRLKEKRYKVSSLLQTIKGPRSKLCTQVPCLAVSEWVNWLFNVTINDISVIYVTAHKCAGGLKKKLDLRSGSQRHRHFVGFFNVPVLHRHGTNLFIRWFRHTAPFSRLLRSRWGYGGAHSRLNPPGPHGGFSSEKIESQHYNWK